jgi:hypothetical protein
MNNKKRKQNSKSDASAEQSRDDSSVEEMVGRNREEFSEDREPAPYHFSREELQHKEDLIDRVLGAR